MICPIHNAEMRDYKNDKGAWSSHKLEDGTWCNEKEKKPYQANQALQSTALAQIQVSQARIEARLDKLAEYLSKQGVNQIRKDNTPDGF